MPFPQKTSYRPSTLLGNAEETSSPAVMGKCSGEENHIISLLLLWFSNLFLSCRRILFIPAWYVKSELRNSYGAAFATALAVFLLTGPGELDKIQSPL